MYGSRDDHWDTEFFKMKDIANEQNEFLMEIIEETDDPKLIKKLIKATMVFKHRIKEIYND